MTTGPSRSLFILLPQLGFQPVTIQPNEKICVLCTVLSYNSRAVTLPLGPHVSKSQNPRRRVHSACFCWTNGRRNPPTGLSQVRSLIAIDSRLVHALASIQQLMPLPFYRRRARAPRPPIGCHTNPFPLPFLIANGFASAASRTQPTQRH